MSLRSLIKKGLLLVAITLAHLSIQAQTCTDPNKFADSCDYDGDGVLNIDDLDDDNDGILDSLEGFVVCSTQTAIKPSSATSNNNFGSSSASKVLDEIVSNALTETFGPSLTKSWLHLHPNATGSALVMDTIRLVFNEPKPVSKVAIWTSDAPWDADDGAIKDFTITIHYCNRTWTSDTFTTQAPIGSNTPDTAQIFDLDTTFAKVERIDINIISGWDGTNQVQATYPSGTVAGTYNMVINEIRAVCHGKGGFDTDGDGVLDQFDLDSDNDGISDLVESGQNMLLVDTNKDGRHDSAVNSNGIPLKASGGMGFTPIDSDGDFILNIVDLDSDNDGIPDAVEAQSTATYVSNDGDVSDNDEDKDGVIDLYDTNDNTTKLVGGTFSMPNDDDDDMDSIPDYIDIDSDNDGLLDMFENHNISLHFQDTTCDGIDDATTGTYKDPDGILDNPSTDLINETGDNSEVGFREVLDTDNDGIPDYIDIDDDNDGVLDIIECSESIDVSEMGTLAPHTFSTSNGTLSVAKIGTNGKIEKRTIGGQDYITFNAVNTTTCGSLVLNPKASYLNMDFHDVETNEFLTLKAYYNGFEIDTTYITASHLTTISKNSNGEYTGSTFTSVPDTDDDRNINFFINHPIDSIVICHRTPVTSGRNIVATINSFCQGTDTDGDGIPNHLDPDSDGDGCSDAYESGALTSNVDTVAGPYSGNGLADSHQATADTNTTNYTSTYSPLALSKNLDLCADSDNDGIPDLVDIDDDNDGVLDAVESPGCFSTSADFPYESGDRTSLITVTSDWTFNQGTLSNVVNGSTTLNTINSVRKTNGDYTFPGTGETFLQFELAEPLTFNTITINHEGAIFLDSDLTGKVQGSKDGSNWTDLTTSGTILPDGASPHTISLTDSLDNYKYYRLWATGGRIDDDEFLSEVTFTKTFIPSKYPKAACSEDFDNDGLYNHLDPDSDGDGCFDSYEAGALSSNVDTVAGPYSDNGLADSHQATADTNTTNYTSTYTPIALSKNLDLCADSDNDGIPDLVDIDDDNDGVLDAVESPGCFSTSADFPYESGDRTSLITVTSDWTFNQGTLSNVVNGSTTLNTTNSVRKTNGDYTFPGTGETFLQFELAEPLTFNTITINHEGAIFLDSDLTGKVQGSKDGSNWTDLTTSGTILPDGASPHTISLTDSLDNYKYYRLWATGGRIDDDEFLSEVTFTKTFIPSKYPKAACSEDFDNDGLYNHLDPDSDGDGCSDAYESGALSSNVDTVAGPYSGNGLADSHQATADTNTTNYTSTYTPIALSKNLDLCADTDNDGIPDLVDIDDDNDGILDAVESPECFYTEIEAVVPSSITSDLLHTDPTTELYDGNNTALFNFTPSNQDVVIGDVIFKIEYQVPIILDTLNITHNVASNPAGTASDITANLWGSTDGVTYVNLSVSPITLVTTPIEMPVTTPLAYKFYEVRAANNVLNQIDAGNTIGEITASIRNFVPSGNPKAACSSDLDGDGIFNHLDPDSDGDGCSDAYESGLVTSDIDTVSAPYSGNGFADSLQSTADTNTYIGTYDYKLASDSTLSTCLDSDGDGIADIYDIDDDNDGILDIHEIGVCKPSAKDGLTNYSYWNLSASHSWHDMVPISGVGGSSPKDLLPDVDSYGLPTNLSMANLFGKVSGISEPTSTDNSNIDLLKWDGWIYFPTNLVGTKMKIRTSAATAVVGAGAWAISSDNNPKNWIDPIDPNTGTLLLDMNNVSGFSNPDEGWNTPPHGYTDYPTFSGGGAIPDPRDVPEDFEVEITVSDRGHYIINWQIDPVNSWNEHSMEFSTDGGTTWNTILDSSYSSTNLCMLGELDTDGDGIPNRLDLDSDGDGCPDATEAGVTKVLLSGGVPNNNPLDTMVFGGAIAQGPYGMNGLADSLENHDSLHATTSYTSTYDSLALDSTKRTCPIIPDTVTVNIQCDTCKVLACATADDINAFGATFTSCGAPSGYTQTGPDSVGCFTWVSDGTATGKDTSCVIACKNGFCDTTYFILIAPAGPDTITTAPPPCPTCPITACPVVNDVDTSGGTTTYTSCGAPSGYTQTGPDANGCFTFTANGTAMGPDTTCIVTCNNGVCDTTYVIIPNPVSPDTITTAPPPCPTCPITACPVVNDVDTSGGTTTYTSCGAPSGYTQTGPDANGCFTFTANGTAMGPDTTCIVTCNNGVCDTTYVIIPNPVSPDTITTAPPPCPTCPITACPVVNDVDTSGGTTTYTSCGAPSGYTQTGPDANGCFTFTANGTAMGPDTTCIVTCNNGVCDTTYVIIPNPVSPDTITTAPPPCPTCPITACPVVNDVDTSGGTTTYTSCGAPSGYTQTGPDANGCFTFTPDGTAMGPDTTCIVTCNNGVCDTTYVIIPNPVSPDTITTAPPPCPTCPITACPVVNDVDTSGGTTTYTSCGAPSGYTQTGPDANGCFTFTPNGTAMGPDTTCIVTCNNGVCDTTYVIIPNPVSPDTITTAPPPCPTCPITACPVVNDVDTSGGTTTYTSCGAPSGYTQTGPDANGCFTFTANGTAMGPDTTCIVTCNNGVCDTTYVIIPNPVSPDTITTAPPPCPTCPITACPVVNDVDTSGGTTTYTSCGAPSGYTQTGPDANGCFTFTANGTAMGPDTTCIVTCNNGVCDTTYVIIPNPVSPDTITTAPPPCPTCPITACPVINDVDTSGGTTTYTSCGAPSGYTQTGPDANGCFTFTPDGTAMGPDTTCIVTCNNGVCDTTYVIIPNPVSPDTITTAPPPCPICPITACPVVNDVDTSGGTTTYTSCGAPSGYTQTGPDANGCFTFTANGTAMGPDTTCIVTCNNGVCDTTYVIIPNPVSPDTITTLPPPCPTCPITACPVVNDVDTSGGTTTYTSCGAPSGYTQTGPDVNGCFVYTPNGMAMGPDTTCIVTCNNGVCDTTYVIIPNPVSPDTITTLPPPCPTCPITACPVINDVDTSGGTTTYTSCGAPAGYTQTGPDANGCFTFTPDGTAMGPDTTCIVTCNNGVCDTTYVIIPNPVSPDTITTLPPPCPTCPITACPVVNDVDTSGGTTTYSSCGAPSGYTQTGPDANGCFTFTADGTAMGPDTTCIVTCNNGVCDTTYVIIPNPVSPDTITTLPPPCPTCPITACPVINDVDTSGGTTTYTSCGAPSGYTQIGPDANGCFTFTANGTAMGPDTTCIVTCNNGVCDTTYVIIPNPVTPDTITTAPPPCSTCPITACPVVNDVDTSGGTTTYTSCGAPSGYTQTGPDANGCFTFTPDGTAMGPDTTCIVTCNNGVCDTTYVIIPNPVRPDTITTLPPPCPTCPITACPVVNDVDTSGGTTTYTSCGAPSGYTQTGPDANGCFTFTANGTAMGPDTTCIVTCNNGVCDTTYVIIPNPVSPDTTSGRALCPTCPVTICAISDDLDPAGPLDSVMTCATPMGYTASIDSSTGCVTYVAATFITDTLETCVVTCKNGICDTTIIIIYPPLPSPSTPISRPVIDFNVTTPGKSVTGNILTNDFSDSAKCVTTADASTISAMGTTFTTGKGGSLTLDTAGKYTYTPLSGFVGKDTIQYIVCLKLVKPLCKSEYLIIDVIPSIDPTDSNANSIISNPDKMFTYGDTVSTQLLANDADPEQDSVLFCGIKDPANPTSFLTTGTLTTVPGKDTVGNAIADAGDLIIYPTGAVEFVPAVGFIGTIELTYKICDDGTPKACKEELLIINAVDTPIFTLDDRPPYANDDFSITDKDVPVLGNFFDNDMDPDKGDSLWYEGFYIDPTGPVTPIDTLTTANGGTVVIMNDGSYLYTPPLGFVGTDQVVYEICDTLSPRQCTKGTIHLLVTGVHTDFGDLPPLWPIRSAKYVDINTNTFPDGKRPYWLGGTISHEGTHQFNAGATADAGDDGLIYPTILDSTDAINNKFQVIVNSDSSGIPVHFKLSIDWNMDGTFDDFYTGMGTTSSPDTVDVFVSTPPGLMAGAVAIRLVAQTDSTKLDDPIIRTGEIEDYIINFTQVLPVDWLSFNATNINDELGKLEWSTASESNSDRFDIYRSLEGSNFEYIGSQKAAGNSSSVKSYLYFDSIGNLPNGKIYYRIKQTDQNAQFEWSETKQIVKYTEAGFVTITPNPATENVSIQLNGWNDGNYEFVLYDNIGKKIQSFAINSVDEYGVINIDVSQLPAGIYNLTSNGLAYKVQVIK